MPATLATVNAITKEIYEGNITEQINTDAVALRRIERTSDGVTNNVGGKYVVFPIHTRRNAGIGARNELEALPTAGQQGFAAGRVGLKYLYGRAQLSGQTMELVESNVQAFSSALSLEMRGLRTDVTKDLNRQVYGNGTGVMATVTADGANTVTVDTVQYLEVGQQVDILQSDISTVRASNRQITAINTTTKVVTYSGADVTAVAGDVIVRTGNNNREITGLKSMVAASGIIYNIDPAVEPSWVANVNSTGGALSEGMLIDMADQIRTKGGKTTLILTTLGVRRAYFNLLSQQRQYVNTKEFTGGFNGLAFTTDAGEIPMIVDVDAPPSTVYFLNEDEIRVYQDGDWSFLQRDGGIWKWVVGFDAFECVLKKYMEVGTHRRNTHGVIQNVTEG